MRAGAACSKPAVDPRAARDRAAWATDADHGYTPIRRTSDNNEQRHRFVALPVIASPVLM